MHVHVCQKECACASLRVLVHPYTCMHASMREILAHEKMDRAYARESDQCLRARRKRVRRCMMK